MSNLDDFDGAAREQRTAIFPVVAMPTSAADLLGYVLVASAAISVAAAAVQALSFHLPQPPNPPVGFPANLPTSVTHLRLTAPDRVQLLSRGAGAFTAVLVLLGALCLVISRRSDDGRDRWRVTGLSAAAGVAAIVLVANGAVCVEILVNARGTFIAPALANRFASIVGLLAPIAISAGVLFYVIVHFTSEPAQVVAGDD